MAFSQRVRRSELATRNHGSTVIVFYLRRARGSRDLTPVGELLREQQPELIISRQKLEQARGIELVRIRREQQNQDLCFSSRPFVLCGLPVRRLPKEQLLYQRRNGQFTLQITGHPEFGVPFGQDRLVPIFLATLRRAAEEPDDSVPHRR